MKRILITGTDSYIGDNVARYLARWKEKYIVHKVDMKDSAWRDMDFNIYDCIFHVAGIAHADTGRVSGAEKDFYYRVNTELALETAQKAKEQGIRQFIFMSTANVYGKSAPIGKKKVITADTPVQILNLNGDSKLRAEEGLRQLEAEDFRVVILRAPMIYGRGCKGNYAILSGLAKRVPVFPKIKNERSVLYIENLAEFVRLMIDNEERGIFFPCDKEYFCTSEVARQIAAEHGRKLFLVPGCTWLLKLCGLFSEKVNKAFGNFTYEKALGEYKEEYRRYALTGGIRLSERKGKGEKRAR